MNSLLDIGMTLAILLLLAPLVYSLVEKLGLPQWLKTWACSFALCFACSSLGLLEWILPLMFSAPLVVGLVMIFGRIHGGSEAFDEQFKGSWKGLAWNMVGMLAAATLFLTRGCP